SRSDRASVKNSPGSPASPRCAKTHRGVSARAMLNGGDSQQNGVRHKPCFILTLGSCPPMPHAPQLSLLWSRTRLWFSSGVGKWVGIALAVVLGFQVLYLLSANVVLAYFLPGWLAAD